MPKQSENIQKQTIILERNYIFLLVSNKLSGISAFPSIKTAHSEFARIKTKRPTTTNKSFISILGLS